MAAYRVLKTSFPPVLRQYLPEHEDSTSDNVTSVPEDDDDNDKENNYGVSDDDEKDHHQPLQRAKSVTLAADDQSDRDKKAGGGKQGSTYSGGSSRGGLPHAHPHHHPPRRGQTALSLVSTGSSGRRANLRKREAEAERLEHVAEVWDQARAEVLSERHVQLQEKVQLQHKLLQAQELHASQLRQLRQEQEASKRQQEKQKKQTKEAALQDVCKQSLEADKKKASELRQGGTGGRKSTTTSAPTTTPPTTAPSTPCSSDGSDTRNDSSDSSSGGARKAAGGTRGSRSHPGYRPSMGLPQQQLPSTPMRELEDEGLEDEDEGKGALGTAGMPAHHAQLYELYGKQADYFLHPKPIPANTQPQRRQTHPKLKHQKGHIGAGELWDTLRQDSRDKLIRNDCRFPQELKSAFSAFVRERLTKHVRPVERSFCATEDVPDIKRLMDQSKLRSTRLYRHKTELMYRSSLTNKDRTSILLHNNPMPDITETGQADSISRYLPSWMEDQSEVSEEEYMKWIKARKEEEEEEEEREEDNKENVRHSAHSRQLSETTNELQNIWHTIAARKKKPKTPRYQFLTEKDAESEGVFSQRFQEEKEQRDKPQPHHLAKAYSALDFSFPSSSFSVPPSRERGRSAEAVDQLHHYRSDWQPLSMGALVEYKKQMETEGQGDFEHGRVKMWPAVSSSVA